MRAAREQPIYYLDSEDLIIATFVWVDDTLKRLADQGLRLPRQPKQKASNSELSTIVGDRSVRPRPLPRLPPDHPGLSPPFPPNSSSLARGHRIHNHALPEAAVGRGPLGGFSGFALAAVMDEGGCFVRCAILPGNARETWAQELVADLTNVLGDRGFRWVEGVKTPPYRLRGGKVVETSWRSWMGRVQNWIETRFGVLVRSFGLQRLESRRFWSLVARVNFIVLVRSRVLLKIAGVKL